ncbi:MAG: hypothetical protein ABW221_25275 [Vicinamibacteria bacterium]
MRLIATHPAAPLSLDAVPAGTPTVLQVHIPLLVAGGTLDVLCLRPDGALWVVGVARTPPRAAMCEVTLPPFPLDGPHVLRVELNGRRLPGELRLTVVADTARRTAQPPGREKSRGSIAS